MDFIDFFSGIGGIRLGLEQSGHKCLGFCEFDKFALESYKAIYDTKGEFESHDVQTVRAIQLPRADLWCYGFPCQDLSTAGLRAGLEYGKRSRLFYEIVRLLKETKEEDKPQWLLAENVKGLLSAGNGFDFARLLFELGNVGYDVEWQVLNSKDFGVPQSRGRVFIVGHKRGQCPGQVFPLTSYASKNHISQIGQLNTPTRVNSNRCRVYDVNGLSPTLNCMGGGQREPCLIDSFVDLSFNDGARPKQIASCLLSRYWKGPGNYKDTYTGVMSVDSKGTKRIRRFTPRECWRLQGFPDEYFDRAKGAGLSDTQLYKQAGNAVTVNVAKAIGERLRELSVPHKGE